MDVGVVTTRSVSTIVAEANPPSAPEQMKSDVENQRHVTLLQQLWYMLINAQDTSNYE